MARARRPSTPPPVPSAAPAPATPSPELAPLEPAKAPAPLPEVEVAPEEPEEPAPRGPIESAPYRVRIMRLTESAQRTAVLANLDADKYRREVDLQTDVAHLEQLELGQTPQS